MDVGIGLPNAVPGTEGRTLVEWARRAEEAGFSTLGTIGRLVYPSYEELIALAAAAAVTSRIRLTTSVLLAPLHANSALFAKQAASLDSISGGRLVLGLGIGGREDDFAASGLTMAGRGRRFDEQLTAMRRIWAGEGRDGIGPIGPPPARPGGPELILGGSAQASFRRVARVADGWIMGGGTPDMFAEAAAAVDQAWQDEGRPGKPRKLSLAYFALGPDARALADGYLGHYYAFLGDMAGQIAAGAAVSPEMVQGYAAAFAEAGCDELIFVPASSSLEQVGLLAEAAGVAPPGSARPREEEPGSSGSPEYFAETGEAVGDDGSVAPIIGGLPAVEGSAWDIGAPRDERGAGLADTQASQADRD